MTYGNTSIALDTVRGTNTKLGVATSTSNTLLGKGMVEEKDKRETDKGIVHHAEGPFDRHEVWAIGM
jgi:hypothetical protein